MNEDAFPIKNGELYTTILVFGSVSTTMRLVGASKKLSSLFQTGHPDPPPGSSGRISSDLVVDDIVHHLAATDKIDKICR